MRIISYICILTGAVFMHMALAQNTLEYKHKLPEEYKYNLLHVTHNHKDTVIYPLKTTRFKESYGVRKGDTSLISHDDLTSLGWIPIKTWSEGGTIKSYAHSGYKYSMVMFFDRCVIGFIANDVILFNGKLQTRRELQLVMKFVGILD